MKKILFLSVLCTLGLSISSCKKKGCTDSSASNYNSNAKKDDGSCLYKPLITLNGVPTVTINVGATYTDAGATAANKDGSAVTVTTTNQVDVTTVGTYFVNYSATNANGTTTAKRTVNVIISADNWTSPTWAVSSTCGATAFPLTNDPTIITGATANAIDIDNFFNLVGGTASGTINGASVTIPLQAINISIGGIPAGDIEFSGTGTMNATGTQIQITYNYTNNTPIGGQGSCMAIYDKQ